MVAPRALKPAEEKKVAEQYAKGTSSQALADKFGVHRSTIVTAVRRNGGTLRKAGGSKARKDTTAPKAKAPATKAPAKAAVKAPAKKASKSVKAKSK